LELDSLQEPSNTNQQLRTKSKKKMPISALYGEEDLQNLPVNLPQPLINLCKWANDALSNDRVLVNVFQPELFGHETKAAIFQSDIHSMVHMNETTASSIVFYIR
jgi:hypothetical protein